MDEFGKVDKEILDLLDVEFSMKLKIVCVKLRHVSKISAVFCSFYRWNFLSFG